MNLSELIVGDTVYLISYHGSSSERKQLLSFGFTPNTPITLIRKSPFGDPLEFRLRGFDVSLRKAQAELIEVSYCGC